MVVRDDSLHMAGYPRLRLVLLLSRNVG